jgi:DNA-binding HxlR family transcriptional regulator
MPSNAKIIAASSVTRALSVIGDRWTLLILRDAFQGAHRFEEFRNLSGAARSTLTSRLNGLVENGLLERVRYSAAPPRFEYRLTAMGLALYGVTLVTWRWEHHWAPSGAGIPRYLRHNVCKHAMQPDTMCSSCGERVELRDTGYEIVANAGRSRAATPALSPPVVGERRESSRHEQRVRAHHRHSRRPLDAAGAVHGISRAAALR